jgi:hypothetical protein
MYRQKTGSPEIYNDRDQETELQIRDAEDRLVSRVVRSYDPYGPIMEEKQIQENPALIFGDKFGLEGRPQPTAAQLEAVNRAMKLMLRGRNGTGISYAYDAQGRMRKPRGFDIDDCSVTIESRLPLLGARRSA